MSTWQEPAVAMWISYLDQSTPMVLLLDHGMPATRISMCLKRNLDQSTPMMLPATRISMCLKRNLDQSTPMVLLLDHGIFYCKHFRS